MNLTIRFSGLVRKGLRFRTKLDQLIIHTFCVAG